MKKLRYVVMAAFCFLLAACGHAPINIAVEASEDINVDEGKHAVPVLVRLYQLSSHAAFESLSFNQIWQSNFQEAGKTILAVDEVVVVPGVSGEQIKMRRENKTQYIAAAGIFREPDACKWRSVEVLPRRLWFMPVKGKLMLESNQLLMTLR